jgi:hypothetical protein
MPIITRILTLPILDTIWIARAVISQREAEKIPNQRKNTKWALNSPKIIAIQYQYREKFH